MTEKNKEYGLSQILTELIKECGLDDVKLSKYTNVPVTTISRMRRSNKANPTTSSLRPIAQFFDISIDQLLGYQPLPENRLPGTYNHCNYTSSIIPIIEWDDVLAFLKDQDTFIQGKLFHWISSERDLSNNAFALTVATNNPILFLKNGSIILIDQKNKIQNEDLVLVSNTTQDKIALYQAIFDGSDMYIKSTNPEINGIKLLPKDFQLVGAVVEIRFGFQQNKASLESISSKTKNFLTLKTIGKYFS